jgi:hypothetical protein
MQAAWCPSSIQPQWQGMLHEAGRHPVGGRKQPFMGLRKLGTSLIRKSTALDGYCRFDVLVICSTV